MIINELSEKVFSELESLFLIPLGMQFQKYTFGFGMLTNFREEKDTLR